MSYLVVCPQYIHFRKLRICMFNDLANLTHSFKANFHMTPVIIGHSYNDNLTRILDA